MTADEPPNGEDYASQRTVFQHGLLRVLRTRRVESAVWSEPGRQEALVADQDRDDREPGRIHGPQSRSSTLATSAANLPYGSLAAAGFATKSKRRLRAGAGNASSAPRILRRIKFRTTAGPTVLATEKAARPVPEAASAA
jgi:hypothetical protein